MEFLHGKRPFVSVAVRHWKRCVGHFQQTRPSRKSCLTYNTKANRESPTADFHSTKTPHLALSTEDVPQYKQGVMAGAKFNIVGVPLPENLMSRKTEARIFHASNVATDRDERSCFCCALLPHNFSKIYISKK